MLISPLIMAGQPPLEVTSSVATIAITSIGPQESSGNVPLGYTIDQNDSTVEAVVFLAASANPAASDFNTGATSGYIDLGQVALTVGGTDIALSGPDGLDGSYKVAFLPTGGGDGDVAVSDAVTIDSTAPALSSVTNTQTGSTTADWGATSDEASDIIFAAVRLNASGVLTKTEIENGTGNAVATSTDASPTADSANGGSFSGLTASTTYIVDTFQRDAVGNESPVTSAAAPFTTTAGGATIASIIASEGGAYFDTGDTSTMWQDIGAATTAVTTANDPVGHMTAKEGTTTAGAPNTADRRLWDGAEMLENSTDGDDYISVVLDAPLQTADVFVAFILDPQNSPVEDRINLIGNATEYVGLGIAATSSPNNTGDTVVYRKDGVDQTIVDRQDILDTFGTGGPMVVEIDGVSTVGWSEMTFGIYLGNDSFSVKGKVGHMVIIPGGTSTANQAAIRAELAAIRDTITDA